MYKRATLLKKLATCGLISVHGPWSRAIQHRYLTGPPPGASAGTPPRPLWPGGSKMHGQRFTPKGGFDTCYVAGDLITAALEVQLMVQGPGGPVPVKASAPAVFVTIDGVVLNVLDMTAPANLALVGTSLAELLGPWAYVPGGGWAPTQVLGEAAYASRRIHGIRYPSAKNHAAGGVCLAIFPDRLNPDHETLEVFDPSRQLVDRLP